MITEQAVAAFLALPDKRLARAMSWTFKQGNYTPAIRIFQTAFRAGLDAPEGIIVRAFYREAFVVVKGQARIEIPDSMGVALHMGTEVVFAIHTRIGQEHQNRPHIAAGRPHFGALVDSATHRHIWVGEYGYAEPLQDLLTLDLVFARFYQETNIVPITYVDPLRGQQGSLL